MFNLLITIYNKYELAGVEKWQRKVIKQVFYDRNAGANLNHTGSEKANKVLLIIPRNIGDRTGYLSPNEFNNLVNKSNNWTIAEGDTLILGECITEIIKSVKELPDKYLITSVDFKNYSSDMANWEVNAR